MANNLQLFLKAHKFFFFLYLLPLALLFWFVARFSVNVPFWDDWDIVFLYDLISTGNVTFADFFAQHNEHRMFFPNIIIAILTFISQYNIQYQLLFSIFLSIISLLLILQISFNQFEYKDPKIAQTANILTCIFIFSIVQWDNWLWGFQIAWFLINLCLITAIFVLSSSKIHSNNLKIFLAAVLCFIASFSSLHGLLSWLALLPLIIVTTPGNFKQKVAVNGLWLVLFIICCVIYFTGYIKPENKIDLFFFVKQPITVANFFLTSLGASLGFATKNKVKFLIEITPFIGLIMFSSFAFFNIYALKKFKSSFTLNAVPWLSLGWFSVIFAGIIAVGRSSAPESFNPYISRYTTGSILLLISLVQTWILYAHDNYTENIKSGKKAYKFIRVSNFLAIVIVCLMLIKSLSPLLINAPKDKVERESAKICLELINYLTNELQGNCLQYLYPFDPSQKKLKKSAEILERLNFRYFPKNISFVEKPTQTYGSIDSPNSLNIKSNKKLRLTGTFKLENLREFSNIVLLSHGNNRNFFTGIPIDLSSKGAGQDQKINWETDFLPTFLPPEETIIKAWLYDSPKKQFVQLLGEARVKVEDKK